MGTVPQEHKSPTASREQEWDWDEGRDIDALIEHGGWAAVANAHAWYDPAAEEHDPPREKQAYKLPHHALEGRELKLVFRGVSSAIGVLNGGRGGVDIPASDREAVYKHLAEHYREFGDEPPPLGELG